MKMDRDCEIIFTFLTKRNGKPVSVDLSSFWGKTETTFCWRCIPFHVKLAYHSTFQIFFLFIFCFETSRLRSAIIVLRLLKYGFAFVKNWKFWVCAQAIHINPLFCCGGVSPSLSFHIPQITIIYNNFFGTIDMIGNTFVENVMSIYLLELF